MNRTALPQRIVAWVILGVAILCTVFPFYWMIRTAMTPQADLIAESTQLWPSHPTLINFKRILGLVSVEEAQAAGGSGATINFAIATPTAAQAGTMISSSLSSRHQVR